MLIKVTHNDVILQNSGVIFEIADKPDATLYLAGKCYDAEYHKLSADAFMSQICRDIKTAQCCHSGIYSAIYYDKKSNDILFFTDALGLGRLYYYINDDILLISDHTDEIVQAADTTFSIDYSAWSQFLAFSYILGNRTYFNEIKSCRPGVINSLHIDSWCLKAIHNEMFTEIKEDATMDFDHAVDAVVHQLKSIIGKILENNKKGRTICPLSGGYDSRCIAACLKNLACDNVETYSSYLDDGNGADNEYAKDIAKYLHFTNVQFTPDDAYFEREIPNYLFDVNYESSMHVTFWDFLRKIDFSGSITFDGYAGDRLFRIARHATINYMEDGTLPPNFLNTFFEKNLIKFPKLCMDKRHYSYLIYLAKQGMDEELQQWNHNITLYYMFNRNTRVMAYSIWHMDQLTNVFTPFADYDLIKFALSIPYAIKSDDSFYKAVMNGLMEGIGNLPSTNDALAQNIIKPIIFNNNRHQTLLLEELNDYWESIGGLYYIDFLKENIQKSNEMKWRLSHLALPFWIYKKWRRNYANRLIMSSLESYFNEFSNILDYEQTAIITNGNADCHKAMDCWLEFIKREAESSAGKHLLNNLIHKHSRKTKVLFTMDVEGFNEGPLFTHGISDFTNSHKAVEQLVFGGRMSNGRTFLETLAADRDIPLTFFVEVYTPILSQGELPKLLSLCSSTGNEAALHCHAFGLPQKFLEERGLKPDDYKSEYGFSQILQYGIDIFKNTINTPPYPFAPEIFKCIQITLKYSKRITLK